MGPRGQPGPGLSAAGPCARSRPCGPLRVSPQVRVSRGSVAQFCFTCGILICFTHAGRFSGIPRFRRREVVKRGLCLSWMRGSVRGKGEQELCGEKNVSVPFPEASTRGHYRSLRAETAPPFLYDFGTFNKYRFVCCL